MALAYKTAPPGSATSQPPRSRQQTFGGFMVVPSLLLELPARARHDDNDAATASFHLQKTSRSTQHLCESYFTASCSTIGLPATKTLNKNTPLVAGNLPPTRQG